jgi:hypothetical protein
VSVGPPDARTLTVTTVRHRAEDADERRTSPARPQRVRRSMSTALVSGALVATAVAIGLGAGRMINQFRGKGALAAPLAPRPTTDGPPASAVRGTATPSDHAPPVGSGRESLPPQAAPQEAQQDAPHPRRLATVRGWLRVGGARLAGARVSIDRASAGFAPLEMELPVGPHIVVVTSPGSGEVLARTTVRVTEDSTRSTPARILR